MYKGERKLASFRKQIVQILDGFGYECHRHGTETDKGYYPDNQVKSPRAGDVSGLRMEEDLKQFNKGEAYWRTEFYSSHVDLLPVTIHHSDPKKRNTLERCQEIFYERLLCGYEFDYKDNKGKKAFGTVRLIDYNEPERNTFRAVTLWDGANHDGFYWDVVVTVNMMPLAVVVLQPTSPGHRPCEEAIATLRYQLSKDDTLSTYLQLCIVSDGKHTLCASPTGLEPVFKPWASILGEEGFDDALTPIRSMLRPDRLVDIIQNYNRIMYGPDNRLHKFLADYHQYFAVNAIIGAMKEHLVGKQEDGYWGHVKMLRSEANLSQTGLGDQSETLGQLVYDRILMMPEFWDTEEEGYEWALYTISVFPSEQRLKAIATAEERPLFLVFPEVSTSQCRELMKRFPTAALIQIAQVGDGPFVDDFCGPCLYRVTRKIDKPQLP